MQMAAANGCLGGKLKQCVLVLVCVCVFIARKATHCCVLDVDGVWKALVGYRMRDGLDACVMLIVCVCVRGYATTC